MADTKADLAGVWTLEKSERAGRVSHDPRWTCMLDFDSSGHFSLNSIAVQEIHLRGNDGTVTARSRQEEVTIAGTFVAEKETLRLVCKQPMSEPQREFAASHFGRPTKDGSYLLKMHLEGSLALQAGDYKMFFQRHTKKA